MLMTMLLLHTRSLRAWSLRFSSSFDIKHIGEVQLWCSGTFLIEIGGKSRRQHYQLVHIYVFFPIFFFLLFILFFLQSFFLFFFLGCGCRKHGEIFLLVRKDHFQISCHFHNNFNRDNRIGRVSTT